VTADTVARNASVEWVYGAYRYGLEPLYLPDPGASEPERWIGAAGMLPDWADERLAPAAPRPAVRRPDSESVDELFWFRWITGHQITFVLWHLLARLLRWPPTHAEDRNATVDLLACLAEGYSAMLLYTSSCTRDAYHRLIRPAMYRQHHGFSGSWAPDYRPVRALFQGRIPGWVDGSAHDRLREQVRVNRVVHSGVAARLVPGSESLLQQAIPAMRIQDRATLGIIYDQFFLTVRGSMSDDRIVEQLLRRLRAALADVDQNGLYPGGTPAAEETPAEHRCAFTAECERQFPGITARIAVCSCGLPNSLWRREQHARSGGGRPAG
jgi:hypothetical protein